MSEIDHETENKRLTDQLEKANGESARRKRELGELRDELAILKAESSDNLKSEIATLKGEIRSIRHRDGFQTILADKELGLASKVSAANLMKLLDYQPDGDFDAETTRERVLALKNECPYLFNSKQSDEEPVAPQSPAWSGRGVNQPETQKPVKLTASQLRDPVFMLNYYKTK